MSAWNRVEPVERERVGEGDHFPSQSPTTQTSDFLERDCEGPALSHPMASSWSRRALCPAAKLARIDRGGSPGETVQGATGTLEVKCGHGGPEGEGDLRPRL